MTESLAVAIASLSTQEREALLSTLTSDEASQILYDWDFWARPSQKEPVPNELWRVWALITGRGFGKTRVGAETVRKYAEKALVSRIALVGPTTADCRDVMIEGDSGILSISPPEFRPTYTASRRRLVWPNGVQAFTYSSEDPDQLRGPQHGIGWGDEPAAWKHAEDTLSNLRFGLRLNPGKLILTTTPRPIKVIKDLIKQSNTDSTVHITTGTTYENLQNLSDNYRSLIKQFEGTRLGRQELLGALLDDTPGALWSYQNIDDTRIKQLPDFKNIVVAIDPAVTSNPDSNETGIIVAATVDDNLYILEDCSMRGSPESWARLALSKYHYWQADKIIAEVNNGGDLVETVMRTIDPKVPYKAVRAARGKRTRAEPVSAIYEQGRAHHYGTLSALEDQMCAFVGGEQNEEDDRVDALVWAATYLLLDAKKNRKFFSWS